MAKYSCKWIVYSDREMTTAIGEIDGIIGVADTWDGENTSYGPAVGDVNVFTRHVANQYQVYSIGKKYLSYEQDRTNYGMYMPLTWYDTWIYSGYWVLQLSNGTKVIFNRDNPTPAGSYTIECEVSVIHPERGLIYHELHHDLREACVLPFGAPRGVLMDGNIDRGSLNLYADTALFRDVSGNYGIGAIAYTTNIFAVNADRCCIKSATDSQNDFFKAIFDGATSMDPYDDPYYEVEPDGGNPDPPEPETDPDFPPEPQFSATDSGMITLFNPDLQEIQQLADYMWSSSFDISQLFKIFGDPIDAILGLSITPVTVTHGSASQFYVGNIATGVTMYKCAKQFESLDCGSISVGKKYGSYLDYAPYTTAEIYLPFIGTLPIDINDIMGKTVRLLYRFDLVSGACCAMIACGGKVLYTFVGQCSASIPITGHDWTNAVNGVLTIAASVASIAATPGAAAPTGIPAIASATINAAKQNIQKSGSLGGAGGMLGPLMPCLIITRPHAAWPKNLKAYEGYPSFISEKLGDIHGYTEVYKVHLEGIPATDAEITEIENILKGGCIL